MSVTLSAFMSAWPSAFVSRNPLERSIFISRLAGTTPVAAQCSPSSSSWAAGARSTRGRRARAQVGRAGAGGDGRRVLAAAGARGGGGGQCDGGEEEDTLVGQGPAMQRLKQIALLSLGAEYIAALTVTRDIAQHKAHERLGHGQPLDDIANRLRLGPVGAQEFEPRRRGEEQIAQGDDGAAIQRRRAHLAHAATVDCLLYTSPSPRDLSTSRMPSSA